MFVVRPITSLLLLTVYFQSVFTAVGDRKRVFGNVLHDNVAVMANYLFAGDSTASKVLMWDLSSGNLLKTFGNYELSYSIAALNGFLYYARTDYAISKVDVIAGNSVCTMVGHDAPVNAIEVFRNSMYSGDLDGIMIQWDISTCMQVRRYDWGSSINGLKATSRYVYMATAWPDVIEWDPSKGDYVRTFSSKAEIDLFAVDVTNSQLFAGDIEGNIYVWSLTAPSAPLRRLQCNQVQAQVWSIKVFGSSIFCASDVSDVKQLSISSGALVRSFNTVPAPSDGVFALAIQSPNMYAAQDNGVYEWDIGYAVNSASGPVNPGLAEPTATVDINVSPRTSSASNLNYILINQNPQPDNSAAVAVSLSVLFVVICLGVLAYVLIKRRKTFSNGIATASSGNLLESNLGNLEFKSPDKRSMQGNTSSVENARMKKIGMTP